MLAIVKILPQNMLLIKIFQLQNIHGNRCMQTM